MNPGSDAIGNVTSGRWSKSCSVVPGLWTRIIPCGVAPWMSASVTAEYAGWSSDPWPSTRTQSPIASACSTSHSTVPWAKSLMSRSTATPQPSIIIPVWPVGTNDARCRPRPAAAARNSRATDILPIAQSRPDGQHHPLAGAVAATDRGLHPLRRAPVVDDRASRGRRRPRRTPGSSPRNVWSPDRTSRPAAIAARIVARHVAGSLPPVGAMPISSASGRGGQGQRLVQRRHDRDVVARAGTRPRSGRPRSNPGPPRPRRARSGSRRTRSWRCGHRTGPR